MDEAWWSGRYKAVVCQSLDSLLYDPPSLGTSSDVRLRSIVEIALAPPEVEAILGVDAVRCQELLDLYDVRAARMVPPEGMLRIDSSVWSARGVDVTALCSALLIPFFHPRDISRVVRNEQSGKVRIEAAPFEVREPIDALLLDIRRGYRRWRDPGVIEAIASQCTCAAAAGLFLFGGDTPAIAGPVMQVWHRTCGVPMAVIKARRQDVQSIIDGIDEQMGIFGEGWDTLCDQWWTDVCRDNTVTLQFISMSGAREIERRMPGTELNPSRLLYKAVLLEPGPLRTEEHNAMVAMAMVDNPYARRYLELFPCAGSAAQ